MGFRSSLATVPVDNGECHVLVVDDDTELGRALSEYLEGEGYRVSYLPDGSRALAEVESGKYDLVLIDVRMPGVDGLDILRAIKRSRPETRAVVMTGCFDDAVFHRAMGEKGDGQLWVDGFLYKPFSPVDVCQCLEKVREGTPYFDFAAMRTGRL